MAHCCFSKGCELEAQYMCQCLSSMTYCCEFHLQAHLKLPNRAHIFDSVLAEPSEFAKDAILKFLTEEKLKKENLKKIVLALTRNSDNTENKFKSRLSGLKSELKEISTIIEKISQIPQHATDISEEILQNGSEEYADIRLFFQLGHLRNKKSEFLNRANNDAEIEQDFRKTCELFKNHASNSQLNQAYQEYINEYQKFTSTYFIDEEANLYCYNTEKEKEKHILIPEASNHTNSLARLPNGEFFIIGWNESSQIAFILEENYQIRKLPLGEPVECFNAIYYNRSVYCFGKISNHWNTRKFDLEKNRWIELASFKNSICDYFNSVIFNRNILISTGFNRSIWLYSIDIDSFSKIPYRFVRSEKILINTENRLYLIECNGWIYESEDEYNWKRIAKSIIKDCEKQVYYSYNKGGIYISILSSDFREYFKFDINQKTLIEISFYSNYISLKRSGINLEAISCYDLIFNPSHAAIYIDKGYTLCHIGKYLGELMQINPLISQWSDDIINYGILLNVKGRILHNLGRYLEAIECYNEMIRNDPGNSKVYKANKENAYRGKGFSLLELNRYDKAVKCYNKAIKLEPDDSDNYLDKGKALMNLGKYIEAIECFSHFIKLKPESDIPYNKKGEALYNLDRNVEAIDCYNKAIKLNCNKPIYYCNRGNALKKLGREAEAFQDFNKADDLNKIRE